MNCKSTLKKVFHGRGLIRQWVSASATSVQSFCHFYQQSMGGNFRVAIHPPIFNSIAPRKAKIICNFSLSECNRVKKGNNVHDLFCSPGK